MFPNNHGWRYPQPPPRDVELNRNSPQAKGLLLWLDFRRGRVVGGETVYDRSPSKKYAYFDSGPGYNRVYDPLIGPAIDFRGLIKEDSIVIGDWSAVEGIDKLSLSAWINPDTLTNSVWVAKHSASTNGAFYMALINSSTVRFTVITAGGRKDHNVSYSFSAGTWYHVVGVYDGVDIRIYINGIHIGTPSAKTGTIKNVASNLRIGAYDGGWAFEGRIAEPRIYNQALSAGVAWAMYDPATRWDLYKHITPSLWPVGVVGDVQVNKDLDVQYDILNLVNKDLQTKFDIFDLVNKDLEGIWDITELINKDLEGIWDIDVLVYKDTQAKWDIDVLVYKDIQAKWDIFDIVNKDLQADWDIFNLVNEDLQGIWDIAELVNKDLQAIWDMEGIVSKDLQGIWDIAELVNKDLQADWDIFNSVNKDLQAIWDMRQLAGKSIQGVWDIEGIVYKDIQGIWDIIELVNKDLEGVWDIDVLVYKDIQAKWDIFNSVNKDLEAIWDMAGVVNKDLEAIWDLFGAVGIRSILGLWRILSISRNIRRFR